MLDTVFNILKVSVVIAISALFLSAINLLVGGIASIVFGNFVGEFLSLISMYLPFDSLLVFGSIGVSCSAIFSFLIAKKIFDLTSWSVSSA